MSAIEHLLPWDAQPQEAVQPSAWAAQNGVTLLTYGGMLYDAATGRPQSRGLAGAGAVDVVVNSAGIGAVATSSAAAAVLTGRTVFNNAAWTVVVVTSSMPVNLGAWISHVDASGNVVRVGANFDRLDTDANDDSIAVLLLEAGVQRSGCRVAGVLNGEPRAFVVRHVRGSTPRIWVDGTERSVSNPNSDAFTAQPIKSSGDTHVYGNATNSTFAPGGVGNLVAVLGAAVDPAACATLSTIGGAYSALFEPRRIWVPVSAGSGGSWSVSLTESASASDSLAAATTALVSLIESASAADIITAATIAAVALTEAASASDTQTASYSATGSGSVTESASATDTLGAANTMLRALTETASADDQLAAATTMLRAISESASAVDTPAASYSGAGTATIEELTSATDALTAAATLLVTILEAGSATDALAAATTMVRAITEQATAADEVAASQPIIASVSITELATAIDVLIGELAGGAWVAGDGLMSRPRIGMARNGDLYSLVLDDDGIPVACKRMGTSRLLKLRALPGGNQAQVMVETGVVLVVL